MKYTVTNWIEDFQKDGRVCFSLVETIEKFPSRNGIIWKNCWEQNFVRYTNAERVVICSICGKH